jgi:hypothetical protein
MESETVVSLCRRGVYVADRGEASMHSAHHGQSLFRRAGLNYNHAVNAASDHPASALVRAPMPRRTKVVFAAVCLLLVLAEVCELEPVSTERQ